MEDYTASFTTGTPIKVWHARWMDFRKENPDAGNVFSPGNWYWFYSMMILLPVQMQGRNDVKTAGDFTEGYFMFLYRVLG